MSTRWEHTHDDKCVKLGPLENIWVPVCEHCDCRQDEHLCPNQQEKLIMGQLNLVAGDLEIIKERVEDALAYLNRCIKKDYGAPPKVGT